MFIKISYLLHTAAKAQASDYFFWGRSKYLVGVSKRAVSRTQQLRLYHQIFVSGGCMFFFIFSHMNERQGCEKKDLYRIKHGSQGSCVIFFRWVYVLLHYLLHTVAKARAPGLKKERLVYIQQKLFFLVYVLFH